MLYERIPQVIATNNEKGSRTAIVAKGMNSSAKKNAKLGKTLSSYSTVESDLLMELEYAHDLF